MTISRKLALLFAVLLVVGAVACGNQEQTAEQPPAAAPTAEEMPAGHPPIQQPDPTSMMPTPVVTEGNVLSWTAPEGWVQEPPANAMRQSQYRVPGSAGDGECVVYYFGAGQGGGPMANAERWAGQFTQPDGSPSIEAMETEEVVANGLDTLLIKVSGTYSSGGMMTGAPAQTMPGYKLLGAVVEGPDSNWFFKFTGPAATIDENAEAFRALIDSVQPPA